ncbi:MAG: hypothetical protein H0T73_17035 [Ardenticatenales bacterium]|nr:hypothetical protein [Ardenticatenales bacterium]
MKWWLPVAVLLALVLTACAGSTPITEPVEGTRVVTAESEPAATREAVATEPPATPLPTQLPYAPTATPVAEVRIVELEWPPEMRLGDSDLLRLSLLPQGEDYVITTEFEGHETLTNTVQVTPREGYDLHALARLDAVTFTHSPEGDQLRTLMLGEPVSWRWTLTPQQAGQHRLSIYLALQWLPTAGSALPAREAEIFSRGLTVQVLSFMGLTKTQAMWAGIMALLFGSTLSLPFVAFVLRPRLVSSLAAAPNNNLLIELPPGYDLSAREATLLRALFRAYVRLTVKAEFRSGYSGARIFLALPIRADGRADAHTIAKLGERSSIEQEFENYETFVKHTLPPMTARIQNAPVVVPGAGWNPFQREREQPEWAALRYTFIGEPG